MKKVLNNITKNFYSDEWYTDVGTVDKMIELLDPDPNSRIICPFDTEKSIFVKRLKELGHTVIYNIFDFIENDAYDFDYIITNPPFSIKNQVISKCLKSNKRACLVLPIDSLGGVKRHSLYREYGIKPLVYIPTKRVNYFDEKWDKKEGSNFHSIFLILDKKNIKSEIIFEFEEEKIKQLNLF
jgi:sugar-phospahte nucleotidyltransferase